jgi:ribosomal protein S18 acetylase RimI-like enzyme
MGTRELRVQRFAPSAARAFRAQLCGLPILHDEAVKDGHPAGVSLVRGFYTFLMLEMREARIADAEVITHHRRQMFADARTAGDDVLKEMSRHFRPWVETMIAEGKYFGWLAMDGGRVAAGTGLLLLDWPPHPFDPAGGQRGYLLNVYVEPEYRRLRLASRLVELAVAEAHRRQIKVVSLHATDAGRKVYEQLGFQETNEMLHVGTFS